MFPANTSQEDLIRASTSFDLARQLPPVDWSKAPRQLPEMDIIQGVDGPHGIFADRMETGIRISANTFAQPAHLRSFADFLARIDSAGTPVPYRQVY
jgi:hypothetical protein